MREAVAESENLTVNEIVRAKEIFKREITEHFHTYNMPGYYSLCE